MLRRGSALVFRGVRTRSAAPGLEAGAKARVPLGATTRQSVSAEQVVPTHG